MSTSTPVPHETAVVLLNLGSPATPRAADVRVYLKEFLSDPYVIDTSWLVRKILVDGIILNTRPKKTAEAYSKIWTPQGSPLVTHTQDLVNKVKSKLNNSVFMAMRYGSPSIPETLKQIKEQGFNKIVFLPLYPQYSYAATESSIVEFLKQQQRILPQSTTKVIEDFFNDAGFIKAVSATVRPVWERTKADLLLLSYHGIPERQIAKTIKPPKVCCVPGCCDTWGNKNQSCYKAQCYETSRLLAADLGLSDKQYFVAFQSRLGRTKWIEPYTDIILQDLPKKGVKRLLVSSPSFTADCLETLEEIQIRYKEVFMNSGGEYFEYIPCVNSDPLFVEAVCEIVKRRLENLYN